MFPTLAAAAMFDNEPTVFLAQGIVALS